MATEIEVNTSTFYLKVNNKYSFRVSNFTSHPKMTLSLLAFDEDSK